MRGAAWFILSSRGQGFGFVVGRWCVPALMDVLVGRSPAQGLGPASATEGTSRVRARIALSSAGPGTCAFR